MHSSKLSLNRAIGRDSNGSFFCEIYCRRWFESIDASNDFEIDNCLLLFQVSIKNGYLYSVK